MDWRFSCFFLSYYRRLGGYYLFSHFSQRYKNILIKYLVEMVQICHTNQPRFGLVWRDAPVAVRFRYLPWVDQYSCWSLNSKARSVEYVCLIMGLQLCDTLLSWHCLEYCSLPVLCVVSRSYCGRVLQHIFVSFALRTTMRTCVPNFSVICTTFVCS
jgi:hypothetical protein